MPANRPFVLGLTGGIASGKSAAAEQLLSLGADVIDADEISRALTAPGGAALPAIRGAFGGAVFYPDDTLNRRALGDIIFSNEEKRRTLEGILHPMIQRITIERIENSAAPICVINAPLLFESGMDALCGAVWVMGLEPEKQILRLMNRDEITRAQAEARIDSQMPLAEKMRRADAVIDNGHAFEHTKRELTLRYKALLRAVAGESTEK